MVSVALQYINFLTVFGVGNFDPQEATTLFAPDIKKIVNSKIICNNRDQLMQQMLDVKKEFGITSVHLLETLSISNNQAAVIRWEISFNDGSTECVISLLKFDTSGHITEINEVFGEKYGYSWQS